MGCDVTETVTGILIEHSVQDFGPEYVKWNYEVIGLTDWTAVGL